MKAAISAGPKNEFELFQAVDRLSLDSPLVSAMLRRVAMYPLDRWQILLVLIEELAKENMRLRDQSKGGNAYRRTPKRIVSR